MVKPYVDCSQNAKVVISWDTLTIAFKSMLMTPSDESGSGKNLVPAFTPTSSCIEVKPIFLKHIRKLQKQGTQSKI